MIKKLSTMSGWSYNLFNKHSGARDKRYTFTHSSTLHRCTTASLEARRSSRDPFEGIAIHAKIFLNFSTTYISTDLQCSKLPRFPT